MTNEQKLDIMNISEATNFLISLTTEADKKSKIKIYESFVGILTDLKSRDLTENQRHSIEQELEIIDLKGFPENGKKQLKRKFNAFTRYLKDELSLISIGYYTAIGMSLGMCFGVALGDHYCFLLEGIQELGWDLV